MPGRKVEYSRAEETEENEPKQQENKTTIWTVLNYILMAYLAYMGIKYFYSS